jgi:polyhydroxyalkanoate synthesis repressor PhaR
MAKDKEPTTIKKYANRRLYNTGTSTYVTLEDLADMVKSGEDFTVVDAKTGEDITRSVLTQIIFEQENKGPNLLPITFLRQLIRFYGDSIQNLIPTYLDFSIDSLVREQEKLRSQMTSAFGPGAFGTAAFGPGAMDAINDQVRRNTEMFEQAMRMFLPFGNSGRTATDSNAGDNGTRAEPSAAKPAAGDVEALRRQLDEMQKRLDKLSTKE